MKKKRGTYCGSSLYLDDRHGGLGGRDDHGWGVECRPVSSKDEEQDLRKLTAEKLRVGR